MEDHHPLIPQTTPSTARVHILRRVSPHRDLRPGFQNGRVLTLDEPTHAPHQPRYSYRPKLAYRRPPIYEPQKPDFPEYQPFHQPEVQPHIQDDIPYTMRPDERLPPPGFYPSNPISLITDGYETHYFILLPPGSTDLINLLKVADTARRLYMDTPPEDIIEHALDRKTLTHISDGPSGGIWVLAAGNEEVASCLVVDFAGGWEILGIGKGMCENQIFLRHPCGFGPDIDEDDDDDEDVETVEDTANSGKGKAKTTTPVTENTRNSNPHTKLNTPSKKPHQSHQQTIHNRPPPHPQSYPAVAKDTPPPLPSLFPSHHQPHRQPNLPKPTHKPMHKPKPATKDPPKEKEAKKPDSYNTLLERFRSKMFVS